MTRVRVYVDGFNLYYGALKPKPALKWLDLVALADRLSPGGDAVDHVRYFTARATAAPDPTTPGRQQLYLRALEMLPRLSIHYGQFRTHPKRMPIVGTAAPVKFANVLRTEEKGSDVNLATWLILDGMDGAFDEAIVISDDSDLAEPIHEANRRFGPVHVISPRGPQITPAGPRRPSVMSTVGTSWTSINPADLAACQLPDEILLPSGRTIHRPPRWR